MLVGDIGKAIDGIVVKRADDHPSPLSIAVEGLAISQPYLVQRTFDLHGTNQVECGRVAVDHQRLQRGGTCAPATTVFASKGMDVRNASNERLVSIAFISGPPGS